MRYIYGLICDSATPNFLFKRTDLRIEFALHGLSTPFFDLESWKPVDMRREAFLSHLLFGFCAAGCTTLCQHLSDFCRSVSTPPAVLIATALSDAASSADYPLPAFKFICEKIYGFSCPANHQRKSLLRQLQNYTDKLQYLTAGFVSEIHTTSSGDFHIVGVILNAIEDFRKRDLQNVAVAHGLETSQTAEGLRNAISFHMTSAACATCIPSSTITPHGAQHAIRCPPDIFARKNHVPRGCLDMYLEFKRVQVAAARSKSMRGDSCLKVNAVEDATDVDTDDDLSESDDDGDICND